METLLEWCQAQVPSQESAIRGGIHRLLGEMRGCAVLPAEGDGLASGAFLPSPASPATWPTRASERAVPLDDLIVFNRSHLRVFESDPAYRDVFTYVNSFGPRPVHGAEVAAALEMDLARAESMLAQLAELGVVVADEARRYRASKRNFYFPDDEDFFSLRNSNMSHNAASILRRLRHEDLVARKAYRGVVTRELTEEQVRLLLDGVDQLVSGLVSLPETGNPRTIYSLCILFGERFSRSEPAGVVGQSGLLR